MIVNSVALGLGGTHLTKPMMSDIGILRLIVNLSTLRTALSVIAIVLRSRPVPNSFYAYFWIESAYTRVSKDMTIG